MPSEAELPLADVRLAADLAVDQADGKHSGRAGCGQRRQLCAVARHLDAMAGRDRHLTSFVALMRLAARTCQSILPNMSTLGEIEAAIELLPAPNRG